MVAVMRVVAISALFAAAAAAGTAACSRSERTEGTVSATAAHDIPLVSVDEVARSLAAGTVVPVDANGDKTRKRLGVLPGAVLLSDYELFAVSELPADKSKRLVFYCANTQCSASHEAARRARFTGYANVEVMDAGIAGWVAAGNQVQRL